MGQRRHHGNLGFKFRFKFRFSFSSGFRKSPPSPPPLPPILRRTRTALGGSDAGRALQTLPIPAATRHTQCTSCLTQLYASERAHFQTPRARAQVQIQRGTETHNPKPYTLYPIPYTLYPIPYTLYHRQRARMNACAGADSTETFTPKP
jgi:hypothetical protein